MFRLARIAYRCSANAHHAPKPCPGFQAIHNPKIREQVLANGTPQLEALAEVLQSLTNAETEYLNLRLAERRLKAGSSILSSKLLGGSGEQVEGIEYFYQQDWIQKQWKDMQLLQFVLSDAQEEMGEKIEVQAVKDHYDVELTSLDAGQKIKAIKSLRQIFNLGLKEAKDMADRTPSMLKKNMKKDEAEKLKKDLEAVGCVITLK